MKNNKISKILMATTILSSMLIMGCSKAEVRKSASLRESYFKIAEKLAVKEEVNSEYIQDLLSGYNYEKNEEFTVEGGNMDGSNYTQKPYTYTDGDESLNITYSNLNNQEKIDPLYTLKNDKGETNLSVLIPDVEDKEVSYMYTAQRNNLKNHKELLEQLKSKGKWYDVYLKVIDNVCSTNDMKIDDIKNLLGVDYSTNEYAYDEKSDSSLNMIEYTFKANNETFMIQYIKEKDKIFNVFYNNEDTNTIYTVNDKRLINEKEKLHTGIITYVESLDKQRELLNYENN